MSSTHLPGVPAPHWHLHPASPSLPHSVLLDVTFRLMPGNLLLTEHLCTPHPTFTLLHFLILSCVTPFRSFSFCHLSFSSPSHSFSFILSPVPSSSLCQTQSHMAGCSPGLPSSLPRLNSQPGGHSGSVVGQRRPPQRKGK